MVLSAAALNVPPLQVEEAPLHVRVNVGIASPGFTPPPRPDNVERSLDTGFETAAMRAPIWTAFAAAFHCHIAMRKSTHPSVKTVRMLSMTVASTSTPPSSSRLNFCSLRCISQVQYISQSE